MSCDVINILWFLFIFLVSALVIWNTWKSDQNFSKYSRNMSKIHERQAYLHQVYRKGYLTDMEKKKLDKPLDLEEW